MSPAFINYLNEYATWQDTVAQYPVEQEGSYLALGITDECGEVSLALAAGKESSPEATMKECGDALWYASRYAVRVLGVPLGDFLSSINFNVPNTPIIISCGAISAIEKKRIRDGANWTDEVKAQKNEKAYYALQNVIVWINRQLLATGFELHHAYEFNQSKLNHRLEANTIKGDGDNR